MAACKQVRLEGAGVLDTPHNVAVITAFRAGLRVLPPARAAHSSSEYSLAQLYALLVLRAIINKSYRKTEQHIRAYFMTIREWIGISRVPSHSTLSRAALELEPYFSALHAAMLDMAIEKKFSASA